LSDAQGRPYFLWHCDVTLERLRQLLWDPDDEIRAHWVATVMRQAKPDDALVLVPADAMRRILPRIASQLGNRREFWHWYLAATAPHGE
jgi:hypothetical protein